MVLSNFKSASGKLQPEMIEYSSKNRSKQVTLEIFVTVSKDNSYNTNLYINIPKSATYQERV